MLGLDARARHRIGVSLAFVGAQTLKTFIPEPFTGAPQQAFGTAVSLMVLCMPFVVLGALARTFTAYVGSANTYVGIKASSGLVACV
jgi:hypothetical protein